jgi:hypothetical protein
MEQYLIAQPISRRIHFRLSLGAREAVLIAALAALALFLTTLQLDINGSPDPYATDTGEIQNALPRWGTIHYNGYPLYTFLGSVFVALLRSFGITPAAGASLYSAVWGAISVALLTGLILAFKAPPWAAMLASLLYALSTSIWVDASIAEVHTMSMALTFAVLWAAVRFGRSGDKGDLYWLAFWLGQGIAHQRAIALLGFSLLILGFRHWRIIWQRLPVVIGLAALGPLTYLYLPLRAWMGADWTYSAPGTWRGFWALVFYTRSDLVEIPPTVVGWWQRIRDVLGLITGDWPWLLLLLGLLGLCLPGRHASRAEKAALTFGWLLYAPVSFIVWEGRVSDALLAVKLPITAMAAIGLAFASQALGQWRPLVGRFSLGLWLFLAGYLYVTHRPAVLAITRAPGAEETIALAAQAQPAADGRPTSLMALWGNDFWQLAYAQAYEGQLPHLQLVDHDSNFAAILDRGDHLLTLSRTFYQRPVAWWEELLGPVHLASVAPGIIEIARKAEAIPGYGAAPSMAMLDNGVAIRTAELAWTSADTLVLMVEWQAQAVPLAEYSVAVHLVAQDPPIGPQDIVAQADRAHPVDGWYPTARWSAGEIVRDHYMLQVANHAEVKAVRVAMYQVSAEGEFHTSNWVSLPVPPAPS